MGGFLEDEQLEVQGGRKSWFEASLLPWGSGKALPSDRHREAFAR